jgi:hypothetical protein
MPAGVKQINLSFKDFRKAYSIAVMVAHIAPDVGIAAPSHQDHPVLFAVT